MSLEQLIAGRTGLWRGRAAPPVTPIGIPTGYPPLDAVLTWGGWPPASLVEILAVRPESVFGLVLPALARFSKGSRWLLLVDPSLPPFAPALASVKRHQKLTPWRHEELTL